MIIKEKLNKGTTVKTPKSTICNQSNADTIALSIASLLNPQVRHV